MHRAVHPGKSESDIYRAVSLQHLLRTYGHSAIAKICQLCSDAFAFSKTQRYGNVHRLAMVAEAAVQHQVASRRKRAHGLFYGHGLLEEKRGAAGGKISLLRRTA